MEAVEAEEASHDTASEAIDVSYETVVSGLPRKHRPVSR